MTDTIEPDIEAYGKFARASALADYAELLSLKGQNVTREQLSNYADDIGWRADELIRCPGEASSSDDIGEQIFEVLREREDLLKDSYPFEVESGRLRAVERAEETAYVGLLSLLTAHAYGVDLKVPAHQTFELSVAEALSGRPLRVSALAAIRKTSGGFEDALKHACREVGLQATPCAAAIRTHAQDEGVDHLCHLDWNDNRSGTWAFIGQATCTKSEHWQAKMGEPKRDRWRGLLSTIVRPLRFLSVPHHVDRCMMRYLAEGDGIVLDRLRLAAFRSSLLPGEEECVRTVLALRFEPFA